MAVREILLLGNPGLRKRSVPVRGFGHQKWSALVGDLQDTLADFRDLQVFGRGISAPQIGHNYRVIFLHIDRPFPLINPVIVRRSRRTMTLWDDCFSFPDLVVRVRRHLQVDVRYQDLAGKRHILRAEGAMSELIQHEIDHLDGILAIDRAIDTRHIIYRSEHERWQQAGGGVAL
jgi:peptide deformylase